MITLNLLNKPIDVASHLDSAGIIKPINFKITNEDGSLSIFYINRSIRRDKEKLDNDTYVYNFTCEVTVDEKVKLCDLRYNSKNKTWKLYRM